ncbi:MAG TPA: HAD hydrolase-like protein [Anaerolineae bacterium]|nr:HAD hydrolase-like protein [Anaerolineae bacterium]
MTRDETQRSVAHPRAVLWDMDGTLIDSHEYHWLAWRDTLAAESYALTREQFASTFGQRNDTILRATFGPDFPLSEVDRIGGIKETHYRDRVRSRGIAPRSTRRWRTARAAPSSTARSTKTPSSSPARCAN